MKSLMTFLLIFLSYSSVSAANDGICQSIVNQTEEDTLNVLASVDVLTREQWYKTDVILNFSYDECKEHVAQELIEVNGVQYYRFRTTEDSCDGGNTYGSIYSQDLSTPVAHIYDYDTYCREDWSEGEQYITNKCNVKAMELAEQKMQEFGLAMKANHARIELRDPYIYDFITVEGKLESGKDVRLEVLVRKETCEFGSVRISNLRL